MGTLLGIDLGTSSIKAMLLDTESGVIGVEAKAYDVDIPEADYAEQNPEDWWDGEVDEMNEIITESEQRRILHNRVFPGFAFPSLLWIKNKEPENYDRIAQVMQPKDYLRFRLTGCIGTDVSDASATAVFDVGQRRWAWEIIDRFHISRDLFAKCRESEEIAGTVTKACGDDTGLKEGIPVIYGCGDQMAQSIGNGIIREGMIVSNIGTGLLKNIEDACRQFVTLHNTVYEPNRANRDVYRRNYELYHELYGSVKHMN